MTWDGYYEAPLAALQPSSQCGVFAAHAGKAFGSFDRESATEEFVGVLKAYRVTSVTGDRYPGQWCVQAFQKRGITYDHSELPKSGLYIDLLPG